MNLGKKINYRKLKPAQRRALLEWIAEGMTAAEMRERAAALPEPFEPTHGQIAHARAAMNAKWKKKWAEAEDAIVTVGLARQAARLRQLTELYGRHEELLRARATDPDLAGVPGASTGLIVLADVKLGKEIYKYDRGLIGEMRSLLDDIARELGQRQTRVEHSGPAGAPIPVALTEMIELAYGDSTKEPQSSSSEFPGGDSRK